MYFERLFELREDRGLGQKEVAAFLKIDRRVYSNYETGKRDLPVRHLIALARYDRVPSDYILGLTDDPSPPKRSG